MKRIGIIALVISTGISLNAVNDLYKDKNYSLTLSQKGGGGSKGGGNNGSGHSGGGSGGGGVGGWRK